MEPNLGTIIACIVLVVLLVATDRIASVLRDKSRDQATTAQAQANADVFKVMADKLVETMKTFGDQRFASSAIRSVITSDGDPIEGRATNGRTGVPYQRDNGLYRPDGSFARPPAPAAESI